MAFSSGEYEKTLPVELTDLICSYLEVEDVLNLSATNRFWRNAINTNFIWKPLCLKYFNVHPNEEPIIDRKCRVEPSFKIVANSSPNLSDICSWRIRYAQEIHIINNWIAQRYHADEPKDLPWSTHTGFNLGNFLPFCYSTGRTSLFNCAIRDLRNDLIFPLETVKQFCSFRNGFLTGHVNYFSYYAMNKNCFELKIRTAFEKALHPAIPLLADDSFLQNYEKKDLFRNSIRNERYFILYHKVENNTVVVWDFENLNTFSVDLNVVTSTSFSTNHYFLCIAERESSILFLKVLTFGINNGFTLYILNIQNSNIVLLHTYRFKKNLRHTIVGDSLALTSKYQIKFLLSNGMIRNVNCSDVQNLINFRSFYCGIKCQTIEKRKSYVVFLIDKKSFSVQVLQRTSGSDLLRLERFLECGSLDIVIIKDMKCGRNELLQLTKSNTIRLREDFYTHVFKSNKIIKHNSKGAHFW